MKEIKAYQCGYCSKYLKTKGSIANHEKRCFHNPVTKSCVTCANFKKELYRVRDTQHYLDLPICIIGIKLFDKEGRWKLKNNCLKWVERPQEAEELAIYQELNGKTPDTVEVKPSWIDNIPF